MSVAWRGGRARERILLFGGEGVGKTSAALSIANVALGPEDKMWVLDCDDSWDRMVESGRWSELGVEEDWRDRRLVPDLCEEGGKLRIFHTKRWEDHEFAPGKIWSGASPNDWVVIDSVTHLWEDIQEWYVRTVHGEDMPDFMLQHRKDQLKEKKGADGGAGAMLVEWTYINKVWKKVFAEPYLNVFTNKIALAEAMKLRTDDRGDDSEVRSFYGEVGMKPKTQKRLGHNSHTSIYLEYTKTRKYQATTVKDREREKMLRVDLTEADFAKEYLFKIAGWRPRKVD